MLTLATDPQFTQIEQISFGIRSILAYDPDTGAELYQSYGRRATGRPTRYVVAVPSGEFEEYMSDEGLIRRPLTTRAFGLTASDHTEAVRKARTRLEKGRWP